MAARRVRVGGVVARDAGAHVAPGDITVDDQALDHPAGILVALHKPAGHVSSHNDGEGPTVFTLLPAQWLGRLPRPEAVGRLDKETSGLLIVTDDHDLLHRLTSPRHEVDKVYVAVLDAVPEASLIETFAAGTLQLRSETLPCKPAGLRLLDGASAEVTITEGKYHQVRRMFGACGYKVLALHRISVGPWSIDDLAPGEWRDLNVSDLNPATA